MVGKVYVYVVHIFTADIYVHTYCVHENMDKYPSLYNTYIHTYLHTYIQYIPAL